MFVSNYVEVPTGIALGTIAAVLLITIALSLMFPGRTQEQRRAKG